MNPSNINTNYLKINDSSQITRSANSPGVRSIPVNEPDLAQLPPTPVNLQERIGDIASGFASIGSAFLLSTLCEVCGVGVLAGILTGLSSGHLFLTGLVTGQNLGSFSVLSLGINSIWTLPVAIPVGVAAFVPKSICKEMFEHGAAKLGLSGRTKEVFRDMSVYGIGGLVARLISEPLYLASYLMIYAPVLAVTSFLTERVALDNLKRKIENLSSRIPNLEINPEKLNQIFREAKILLNSLPAEEQKKMRKAFSSHALSREGAHVFDVLKIDLNVIKAIESSKNLNLSHLKGVLSAGLNPVDTKLPALPQALAYSSFERVATPFAMSLTCGAVFLLKIIGQVTDITKFGALTGILMGGAGAGAGMILGGPAGALLGGFVGGTVGGIAGGFVGVAFEAFESLEERLEIEEQGETQEQIALFSTLKKEINTLTDQIEGEGNFLPINIARGGLFAPLVLFAEVVISIVKFGTSVSRQFLAVQIEKGILTLKPEFKLNQNTKEIFKELRLLLQELSSQEEEDLREALSQSAGTGVLFLEKFIGKVLSPMRLKSDNKPELNYLKSFLEEMANVAKRVS